jgi:PAS domain S-box-containing protein
MPRKFVRQTIEGFDHGRTVEEVRAESEALFSSIGEGAVATDEFGHITRINPKALDILGLNYKEVIGQWFPRVVRIIKPDGSTLPLIERPIVRMFLSGKPVTEKVIYVTKDGKPIPVSVTVSPIIYDNRPVGAVQVFRDVTLENEVDRMKSEFISLASHQLRTPLSTIQTYAHMLDDDYMGETNADQQRALHTIIAATNTMNELIAMLLNIARIESGSIAINSKRLDVNAIIEDIVKQLQHTAHSKNVALAFHPLQQPVLLVADHLIVKEILLNLLGNAIKYTPSDGKVTISVQQRNNDVLFTIQDNGIGIPKQSQDKIFGKFFRAYNVVRQETTGTGLGLYVVKGLVSTLNGTVWFKSEEGEGTVFYVALPNEYNEKMLVRKEL